MNKLTLMMGHTEENIRARLLKSIRNDVLASLDCHSDEQCIASVQDALEAMNKVSRYQLVKDLGFSLPEAYCNVPLPIGYDVTISQPTVVAMMTGLILQSCPSRQRVLEIGTGSGYQALILAQVFDEVYTIEIIEPVYQRTRKLLEGLKPGTKSGKPLNLSWGNGRRGWPASPGEEVRLFFDAIIGTAAEKSLNRAWIDQLKVGGVLICPMNCGLFNEQRLFRITKLNKQNEIRREPLDFVQFVPMTGDQSDDAESEKRKE